ncbi:NlpC/P60 family protein [Nocardia sp. NPDC051832]|uniref:C40 family peptidase n=1 Tax=Nocardia sp. NPDC051832 TaxID=3155673 RepID=UPI0034339324
MAPELADDISAALRNLLGLYGNAEPLPAQWAEIPQLAAPRPAALPGSAAAGYARTVTALTSIAETHRGPDLSAQRALSGTVDATAGGRKLLTDRIAVLQSQLQAIGTVGDTRLSVPAVLDAAKATLAAATKQVDADFAAARQRAGQITAPTAVKATRRRRPQRRRRTETSSATRQRLMRRTGATDTTAGKKAVSAATNQLDMPYIWGGGGPSGPTGGLARGSVQGFDCSGLTQYAIAQATGGEVILPRTTYDQINSGVRVDPRDVRAGDLIFPGSSFNPSTGRPEHVQLAVDKYWVVEAPQPGQTVRYTPMPHDAVVRRVL